MSTLTPAYSSGDRGLEVRGDGGGPSVLVDLRLGVRGGHAGPVPPASVPESDRCQPAAQLRDPSHLIGVETQHLSSLFTSNRSSRYKYAIAFKSSFLLVVLYWQRAGPLKLCYVCQIPPILHLQYSKWGSEKRKCPCNHLICAFVEQFESWCLYNQNLVP